jgi:glycosyltransferase involved in cell wall biosynthesis
MTRAGVNLSGLSIGIGPQMPGWGSWDWVGAHLIQSFLTDAQVTEFAAWEEPQADMVLVVKHPPPHQWLERIAKRAAVIFLPVDCYGAAEEITADAALLRQFSRIIVHCERLRPHFEPLAPVEYLDHPIKFVTPMRRKFRTDGNILWVGVRSNLEPLVEWLNAHPLPAPLDVLTNLETPDEPAQPGEFRFEPDLPVRIHHWTPELHLEMVAVARAAIDIKGQDFRSKCKPPAKAIDFIASGLPLAMNADSSPVEHLAKLGFAVADPLDTERWLSRDYWQQTRQFGQKLRKAVSENRVAERIRQIVGDALAERSRFTAQAEPTKRKLTKKKEAQKPPRRQSRSKPQTKPVPAPVPPLRLYGLLITKDDHDVFADWCRDQLHLYNSVVCLDGSFTDATARLAEQFSDQLIYLHERDFSIPHKTDHGLRHVVHQEIVRRFGAGHWIMCCHTDEFCYHDPRQIAALAESQGFDQVSWFSPHFYPHPDELTDWAQRRLLPVQERFQYYHWSLRGDGYPWLEDRLYRALPGVDWDGVTHMNVRPLGLKKSAPFYPIFRHFKVVATDPAWYEQEPDCAHYKHHWPGQADRTGLPYPVRKFEDLFVRSLAKYARCDRFEGKFDQPWNMGDQFRAPAPPEVPACERQHRRASDLAIAGRYDDARLLLEQINGASGATRFRALVRNDLATLAALRGEAEVARSGFQAALELDAECMNAQANLKAIEESPLPSAPAIHTCNGALTPKKEERVKVEILSFLFNWPSTGGGIVHTVELARFLGEAGYEVKHIHVRFDPWGIGEVKAPLPFASEALTFDPSTWNAAVIQQRFRQAVDAFRPDYVILTDSWNFKPLLAEAMRGYPYLLRLQAMECLCPLNNVRLLPEPGGRVRQCPLHQLAMPQECARCVHERGQFSGPLHQAERELSGVGTPEYAEKLRRAFAEAEAVLVVNPLAEAMVSPYARQVRVVTAGMDPARFPWPPTIAPTLGDKKRIVFAGLVDEWMKGFHVLREAATLLWHHRQDFDIVATADPHEPADPFVRYVGWQSQEELPKLLAACDILVMPTIAQEALGRTAVEAMAAGKPVVASRLGGLPFTVTDGATGLLCEPGDPADLARKLEMLLDDAALREHLGLAGRRRFEEHYAWPVIIERHYRPLLFRK